MFKSHLHVHLKWLNEQLKPVWKESVTLCKITLVLKYWSIKSKNWHLSFLFSTTILEPFPFCFKRLLHNMSSIRTAGELLSLCPCQLVDVAFFKDWMCYFFDEPQIILQLLKRKLALAFFHSPFPQSCIRQANPGVCQISFCLLTASYLFEDILGAFPFSRVSFDSLVMYK